MAFKLTYGFSCGINRDLVGRSVTAGRNFTAVAQPSPVAGHPRPNISLSLSLSLSLIKFPHGSFPGGAIPEYIFPVAMSATTTTANPPPISAVWADKYRGVRPRLHPSVFTHSLTTPTGHSRRPRPPARPLHTPHRPHLHRAPIRLRARLHPPHRRLLGHARAARVPLHAAAARDAEGGARARER
jgi:hypothetical protein